ncbi:MAG: FlgD immunoglobulin-like domain containing protein [bacterium]
MRLPITCSGVLILLATLTVVSGRSLASVHSYTETFTTTRYRDPAFTTAWWDTVAGAVKLYPLGITVSGSYNTPGMAYEVLVEAGLAYVVDNDRGLQIIDVGDPTTPALLGEQDTDGNSRDLAKAGDYIFIADGINGLVVVDVSNPAAPDTVGSVGVTGFAHGVALAGSYAYLAQSGSGIRVVDVSVPTAPTGVTSIPTNDWAQAVHVRSGYLYVADGNAGVSIFDLGAPADPTPVGQYDTVGFSRDVAVIPPYAFVADGSAGLLVLDLSTPAAPDSVAHLDLPGNCYGLDIDNDRLFVATGSAGLQIIDISMPTNPRLTGTSTALTDARGVAGAGDLVYVADGTAGLKVVELSPDGFNVEANSAQSLVLDAAADPILRARLFTTQVDSIRWYLSADGGGNWQEFQPGDSLCAFSNPGDSLLWRSEHHYLGENQNPACSFLKIEWEKLASAPEIVSVADVLADHGGQVRLSFLRSRYDVAGSSQPITEYSVYRRIDPGLQADGGTIADVSKRAEVLPLPDLLPTYPPGDWDYLLTIPADAEETYHTVLPTLCDATPENGICYTVFFVRARTETPGSYFDSAPDSGYSMDNDLPSIPGDFAVAYHQGDGNQLSWSPSPDPDLQDYRIYRSTTPDFTPGPGNRVKITTDTDWFDAISPGYGYHYQLTATVLSGQESIPTVPLITTAVANPGPLTTTPAPSLVLQQNWPNPFNPLTTIAFSLSRPGRVRLHIVDPRGRRIRTLLAGEHPAGDFQLVWNGRDDHDRMLAAGVYLALLQMDGELVCRKLMLLK